MIKSIPTWYQGIQFRSTLEADWAATFDEWGTYWQYEPEGFQLPNTRYRPDFHLPSQRVWCEVKGPHNERIGKAAELQQALVDASESGSEWGFATYLVVILRPAGPGDTAWWEGSLPQQDIQLLRCSECEHLTWMDFAGLRSCRLHPPASWENSKPWRPTGALYSPGHLTFSRAPRPVPTGVR